jgi:hypothetical protein
MVGWRIAPFEGGAHRPAIRFVRGILPDRAQQRIEFLGRIGVSVSV